MGNRVMDKFPIICFLLLTLLEAKMGVSKQWSFVVNSTFHFSVEEEEEGEGGEDKGAWGEGGEQGEGEEGGGRREEEN